MDTLLNLAQRERVEDNTDYLDLISFRNPQHNILNIRTIIGDEKYMQLLDKFAGSYTRFPTAKNSLEAADDLVLIHLWEEMKSAKASGKLDIWNRAEAAVIRHAKKMGINFRTAQIRARRVVKEIVAARLWVLQHEKTGSTRK